MLGIAAALALYPLAGFLLIAYLVRHYVPKLAAEQLRCQAAVAEVRFNPFPLQVRVETPLARELLAGRFGPGDTVRVEVSDGELAFVREVSTEQLS